MLNRDEMNAIQKQNKKKRICSNLPKKAKTKNQNSTTTTQGEGRK